MAYPSAMSMSTRPRRSCSASRKAKSPRWVRSRQACLPSTADSRATTLLGGASVQIEDSPDSHDRAATLRDMGRHAGEGGVPLNVPPSCGEHPRLIGRQNEELCGPKIWPLLVDVVDSDDRPVRHAV